jgi:hypothetical protein
MSKKKAIEICNNLVQTINKMQHKSIIRKSDNSIFHIPSVSKDFLIKKKDMLVQKYNLNIKKYAITNNEDQGES